MSIVWFISGFVLCLFMPASVQMAVKVVISDLYNSIKDWFVKDKKYKDIAW